MTLRVTVEIVPYGIEEKKHVIHQLDIFNKGSAGDELNYDLYEYGVIQIDPEKRQAGLYSDSILHSRKEGALVLIEKVLSNLVNGDKRERGSD